MQFSPIFVCLFSMYANSVLYQGVYHNTPSYSFKYRLKCAHYDHPNLTDPVCVKDNANKSVTFCPHQAFLPRLGPPAPQTPGLPAPTALVSGQPGKAREQKSSPIQVTPHTTRRRSPNEAPLLWTRLPSRPMSRQRNEVRWRSFLFFSDRD